MGNYKCGFQWQIICADIHGKSYVRLYMVDAMCGFTWINICEGFNGCYIVDFIGKLSVWP